MQSLAVLACAGGGSGYIARALGASAAVSAAVALSIGLAAAYLVGSFLRWLERGSRYQEPTAIEGTVAVVLRRIAGGRTGEVVYTREGARRFLAAKSESGRAIEAGTEVIILRAERGIAEVAPTPEVLGEVIGHG
jgi:membrane protein implicated in regulation of membrane protease activity